METLCLDKAVVTLPGGRKVNLPYPCPISVLLKEPELSVPAPDGVAALEVNGVVTSLSVDLPVRQATVKPVHLLSMEGLSLYRRTLVFVAGMAAVKIFGKQGHTFVAQHKLGNNCYKFVLDDGETQVTAKDAEQLSEEMTKLIEANFTIKETYLSPKEAIEHFKATQRFYSAASVETSNEELIKVCVCEGFAALWFRGLLATTGIAKKFSVRCAKDGSGLLLVFPALIESHDPATGSLKRDVVMPTDDEEIENKLLSDIYQEYHQWGKLIGTGSAGLLNKRILEGEAKTLVATCEALQASKIVNLANMMKEKASKGLKLVLIAGPSASGKTTFASKLGIQLRVIGCQPVVLSVDNYFVPRTETPKDHTGKYNFECLEALRIDKLNDDLCRLVRGELVKTPIFDFKTGLPKEEALPLQLPKGGVLIMEGIHCLNEKLTAKVPPEQKFKIFVAPFAQIKLDELNFQSQSVGRLFRRIVRDYNTRGFSARDTLSRWKSVTDGEMEHIFPFMSEANTIFNTVLDTEYCVLKTYLMPLLRSVSPDMPEYNIARNLVKIIDMFYPISHDDVPPDSLLREFCGGSFFE